ncbi:hypothetical protein [Streptomyces fuscigenes]|uniref:hypothetical protein n=1 Tax=Streptomyces fuscigenes TaxID=1528880 RepID=UPI001F2CBE6A|nr:hypothetical protein [Streptomyces fuscigenes]MCF3961133.1 hypothetical protein [Streptomyces fuscigenes]
MRRHEVKPGRLIVGLVAVAIGALYAGNAAGAWHTEWFAALPLLFGGLVLAALVGFAAHKARRRRRPRSDQAASSDSTGVPASSSGSQAIK